MKWPWVSRRKHERVLAAAMEVEDLFNARARSLRLAEAHIANVEHELAELQFRYEQLDMREKDERWRRLRAEGLAAFKDDRIKSALQLLYSEDSGARKAG